MNDSVRFQTSSDSRARSSGLLLVGGGPQGMSTLEGLFAPRGYKVRSAANARDALEALEHQPACAVVTELRMPAKDGAEFLAEVRIRWPGTARVLVVRRSDIDTALACVENGDADRHLVKPWQPAEALLTVRQALERRDLDRENQRLMDLLMRSNSDAALSRAVEQAVRHRTARLEGAKATAEAEYSRARRGFDNALHALAGLLELQRGYPAGHSRRVSALSVEIGTALGLPEHELHDLRYAGLLHEVGTLLNSRWPQRRALPALTAAELSDLAKHPLRAEFALMSVEPLQRAVELIRAHQETFDGSGYPDGRAGSEIPLGARILAVAHDYDALRNGWLVGRRLKAGEARAWLTVKAGTRYDPAMVDALLHVLDTMPEEGRGAGARIAASDLAAGMTLAADLLGREGVLLLPRGTVLGEHHVEQLRRYVQVEGFEPDPRVLPARA